MSYFAVDGAPYIFVNDNLSQIPRDYSGNTRFFIFIGSNLNYCSSDSLISSINNIIPQASNQGDFLNVTISGSNISFSEFYDDYSGNQWIEYADFQLVFEDYSYIIGGSIFSENGNSAQATINIPIDAPIGNYHVNIYDFNSSSYHELINGFYVNYDSQNNFCDNQSAFYCEDFEGVNSPYLPQHFETSSSQSEYFIPNGNDNIQVNGFYTGTTIDAGLGGYWTYIPEHTTFAMTNDDACQPNGNPPTGSSNCDLSFDVLELPLMDFSEFTQDTTEQSNLWLQFEYFHDMNWGGGDAYVEISTNGGNNWMNLSNGPLDAYHDWQNAYFDLSEYLSYSNVKIRFWWSDNGSWASGFAVDNIVIKELPAYNLVLDEVKANIISTNTNPYNSSIFYPTIPLQQIENIGYSLSGVVKNTGLNYLDSVRLNMSVTIDSLLENSDFYCASHFTDLSPFDELELDCNANIFILQQLVSGLLSFTTSSADIASQKKYHLMYLSMNML